MLILEGWCGWKTWAYKNKNKTKKGVDWNMFRCRYYYLPRYYCYVLCTLLLLLPLSFVTVYFPCRTATTTTMRAWTIFFIFSTRDYNKIQRTDVRFYNTRKKTECARKVNTFKFSLVSYSIIRIVLFEQTELAVVPALNRYFILRARNQMALDFLASSRV